MQAVITVTGALSAPRGVQARGAVPALVDLMPPAALRHVAAKEHLFVEGDRKTSIYQVVSGTLALYRILRDGRRQIFRFVSCGDLAALSLGPIEAMSAQATEATVVKCIPLNALARAIDQSPRLGRLMFEALGAEMEAMQVHLASLGQDGAAARVARFLLNMVERAEAEGSDGQSLHLAMTRADMGDFLGLTLESVSRALSALKAQRVIGIERGTTIHIKRRDQLELAAEGGQDL
ncbi:MAG: helix-turn-helix domain-containing protein [Hyphomonadaceae bacterium]|nr:helix-turn-helix domain-containing protein [Hyphomonadaceae bacterium]